MKSALLAAFLCLAAPALAGQPEAIAQWGGNSGSLPPEYAWDYSVAFFAGGLVRATYCKGYADAAPGCATAEEALTAAQQKAMEAAMQGGAADLLAHPPERAKDGEIPVGGGSVSGWVLLDGEKITLHAYPRPADRARVTAALQVLQQHTPKNLVAKAERRAKQP